MSDKKIKIKYEDFHKLAKYLEDNCKGSYIFIETSNDTKVIFNSTTVVSENVEIILSDDRYYMLPKIKSESDL